MEIKNVETINNDDIYTARLEFRSLGSSEEVAPMITFSHHFPDDYVGAYPAAFLAMRDMAMFLQLQTRDVTNTEVDLPSDPDERARVAISAAQAADATKN